MIKPYPVAYQVAGSHSVSVDFHNRMKRYALQVRSAAPPKTKIFSHQCPCRGLGTAGSIDSLGMERTGRCSRCDGTGFITQEIAA